MKRKLFYSTDDIEQLNNRYIELHKKIENANGLSDGQRNRMDEVLIQKYDYELEELSDMREAEYLTRQAELKAHKKNITPWRRGWWWRLIFQPLTNRAQDIIEKRAELEAEKRFSSEETELNARANEIYGQNSGKLSERKRKKALKKYLELKRLFETSAEPADVPAEEPPEPPARKPRKAKNTEG